MGLEFVVVPNAKHLMAILSPHTIDRTLVMGMDHPKVPPEYT
jgi:hypothetical protein